MSGIKIMKFSHCEHCMYLFHNVKSLMHFNFPAQFHTDSMILHIFLGKKNQLLEWFLFDFLKKSFCINQKNPSQN